MLLRSCGVASRANGRTASLAGASARAAGRSFSVVGPSSSANVSTRPSVSVVCRSVLGQLADRGGDVGLLLGERAEHRGGGVDELGEVVVVRGQLLGEHAERRDEVAQLVAAGGDGAVDAREVAVRGLEAREQVAQVAAAPLEAAAERR